MPSIARIGDEHKGTCNHGAPCCPHSVTGTITGGSNDTLTNGRGTARLNDGVIHDCPHCGTGYISSASGNVKTDGRGIARLGDAVTYPGGSGTITAASGDTFAGD